MSSEVSEPVEAVIPARTRRQAMDWSLVLASQGIEATIHRDELRQWMLLVSPIDHTRALESIRLYRQENRHWDWRQPLPWSGVTYHWGAVVVCLLLAFIHQAAAASPVLQGHWEFRSESFAAGQWWRLFTAVLLHADVAHLLANVTTGVVFFGLVMGRFGAGCALLAAFAAGAAGNVFGYLLHARPYTGLGASGAVMGALGLLAFSHAAQWRSNPVAVRDLLRAAGAGVLLFVLFGVNPNSDVAAHVGGFIAGAGFGAGLSFVPVRVLSGKGFAALAWTVFFLLLLLTTGLGLAHR